MHVTDVQNGVAVEKRWQCRELQLVSLDDNALCIPASPPIESRELQRISNDRRRRRQVFQMEEGASLAKDLRFVIGLYSQSLSGVDRSETLLQFMQDVVVHGITSSEIGSVSEASGSAGHYRVFPSGKQPFRETCHWPVNDRPRRLDSDLSVEESGRARFLQSIDLSRPIAGASHLARNWLDKVCLGHALAEGRFIEPASENPFIDGLQFAKGEPGRQEMHGKRRVLDLVPQSGERAVENVRMIEGRQYGDLISFDRPPCDVGRIGSLPQPHLVRRDQGYIGDTEAP